MKDAKEFLIYMEIHDKVIGYKKPIWLSELLEEYANQRSPQTLSDEAKAIIFQTMKDRIKVLKNHIAQLNNKG